MKTDKVKTPSTNGDNGQRDDKGRFLPGNPGGPGNPFAKKVSCLRSALLSTIQPEDIEAAIKILVAKAKRGSLPAIKELLDRGVGKPLETDLLEELEQLEKTVNDIARTSKCH